MKRKAVLALLTVIVLGGVCFLPSIHQDESYHQFANHAEHLGIPNFWNVVSNFAFLLVAVAAWPRAGASWQLTCFRILLVGIAFTTFGSAYYHAKPSDSRLLWDRLPMTIVLCAFSRSPSSSKSTRVWRARC